eukprot:1141322-Pelagomonas_calceolata.AAC.1
MAADISEIDFWGQNTNTLMECLRKCGIEPTALFYARVFVLISTLVPRVFLIEHLTNCLL